MRASKGSARTCSGDMYDTVPSALPWTVSWSSMVRVGVAVRHGQTDGTDFRQSKVENLGVTARGNENVRGLDVAMDDSRGVGGIQRVGDFDARVEEAFRSAEAPVDSLLQGVSLQELHDDEGRIAVSSIS